MLYMLQVDTLGMAYDEYSGTALATSSLEHLQGKSEAVKPWLPSRCAEIFNLCFLAKPAHPRHIEHTLVLLQMHAPSGPT